MAKYRAKLSFVAYVEIEASDLESARIKAENMVEDRSVYEDEVVDEIYEEAYYAGAAGNDPPLVDKRSYSIRDQDFEPSFAILDSSGKPIMSCWKETKE